MNLTNIIQLADNMTTTQPTYWTVIDWNGERMDLECETMQEADEYAQKVYEETHDEGSDEIKLVRFFYNDNNEPVDIHMLNSVVEVEEYCGSMVEQHGTLWMEK